MPPSQDLVQPAPPTRSTPLACDALLAALGAPRADDVQSLPRTVLVVAHPDDETVGAGSRLSRLRDARLVYVTDGAPRNGRDASRHGQSPAGYAQVRRRELRSALALCGLDMERVLCLGLPDQESALHLTELAASLAELFEHGSVESVLTHPYEGGHPDHDATAFTVHAAAALLRTRGQAAPALVEMTSYHNGPQGIRPCEFLPDPRVDAAMVTVQLAPDEQRHKQSLLACFGTQRQTLAYFPLHVERFRPAPRYNFLRPPHEGRLFYECHDWGMTGARFCALAARAIGSLGLEGRL